MRCCRKTAENVFIFFTIKSKNIRFVKSHQKSIFFISNTEKKNQHGAKKAANEPRSFQKCTPRHGGGDGKAPGEPYKEGVKGGGEGKGRN